MSNVEARRMISSKLAQTLIRLEKGNISREEAVRALESLIPFIAAMNDLEVMRIITGQIKRMKFTETARV